MSRRTISEWKRRARRDEPILVAGRPGHSRAARAAAIKQVRATMTTLLARVGEARLSALLPGVPLRLIRFGLKRTKAHIRKRERLRRKRERTRIVVERAGSVLSMDGAWVGVVDGSAVKLEQVVDVTSGATCALHVGVSLTADDVTAMLDRMIRPRAKVPVAIFHDGGSENVNETVRAWARRERVVLVRNRPRTPQHNPWVERKHADVRAQTDLRSDTCLNSVEEGRTRIEAGLMTLDHRLPRPRLGGLTPAERCRMDGVGYSRGWREETWAAAEAARERARESCVRACDRINAEREAVLDVLERRGVLFRVRGGVRTRRVEWEVIS